MKETHEYLVPDYYNLFSCKMGACRAACCAGWPVSISMEDYFKLLGVNCSEELRRRLDVCLHIVERPMPEEYAQITPRYDGNCHLRMDDGRCALHAELGEDALSCVCRLYPRGLRADGDYECSCANSCEAVIELLFSRDEPIGFIKQALTFDMPKSVGRTVFFETAGREQAIRIHFIHLMQRREYSLPQRLMLLSDSLSDMDAALNAKDEARVTALLQNGGAIPVCAEKLPNWAHLKLGLEAAARMVELFDKSSDSIRRYGEAALKYFGNDAGSFGRYAIARAHFDALIPRWEIYFENMLVNHIFFARFPFQDRPVSLPDEFIALCAVYSLLRFLGIGWMADKNSESDFVDVAAAVFRLVDHTAFDRYAAPALKSIGCGEREKLQELIAL